jgi:DNA-binding transcriptional regulator/RsmH inhibitor MraZ
MRAEEFTRRTLPMFIGEYRHTFDTKNRISLPAKFRKDLGRSVVVTRGLDKCLFIYPKRAWNDEAAKHDTQRGTPQGADLHASCFLVHRRLMWTLPGVFSFPII